MRVLPTAILVISGLALSAGSAAADVLPIGFEDYTPGTLTGANPGYNAADGRLPGAADGARRWWSPGNAASFGEVAPRAARTGSQGLAILRTNPVPFGDPQNLDGVIAGVTTPRLLQIGGESAAPVNAANTRFRFSYWFRTGPTTPTPFLRFGAESWGPLSSPLIGSDRYTWHRFYADASGTLSLFSVGTVNTPAFFPDNDTVVATNLTWGAWYRVEVTVSFVDGGDDNDIVVTRLYDSANTLVGTGVDTTWESGFRYSAFYPTSVFGIDSVAFQARAADDAFAVFTGDVAYIDDITVESLGPVDTELNIVDACDNDSTIEVTIDLAGTNQPVAGGQFFLNFDATKLAFVSATPSAAFPLEILELAGPGTLSYATGIGFGGTPVSAPASFATLTFTKLDDVCAADALTLVSFRPNTPPTRLTDTFGGPIPTTTTDLAPFTMDGEAPVITCPPTITVNADAGFCGATLNYTNDFSAPVPLSATPGIGLWYTDRYAPAGFASGPVPGGTGLVHSISSADSAANRPPSFSGTFYNTQGRAFNIDLPTGFRLGIDLYVPASWATDIRRADIWGVAHDAQDAISAYPIIGFASINPTDNVNAPALPAQPRWRVWDVNNNAWIDLANPVNYNAWNRLEIGVTPTTINYYLNNTLVSSIPNPGSVRLASTIVQSYNFGQSYNVFWDNLTFGPQGPVATDNCDLTTSYVRSDNPSLTLNDPFPTGTTTITWTATDCAGNAASCNQTVTVNPTTTLDVSVELAGVSSGTFTRCISFEFFGATCPAPAATVDAVVTFTSGVGTASIQIPCGNYTCVTARDRRHTLRQTAALTPVGDNYAAAFTGADALRGGNLNDDTYVDILDFGAFAGQFGTNYGSANTTCATPFPHADISGNGTVGIEDYTFIASNFLVFSEVNCCNNLLIAGNDPGAPVYSVSVATLVAQDLWDTARADLNRDGVLNVEDVNLFALRAPSACAADFNSDGVATVQDIYTFLNAWFSQHPASDLNRDQATTVNDLFTFLAVWFQGC